MGRFRFPLAAAWRVRQLQVQREEAALQQLLAQKAALDAQGEQLNLAEAGARASAGVTGRPVFGLEAYLAGVQRERTRLAQAAAGLKADIENQRVRLTKAQTEERLLEKLRDQHWAVWRAAEASAVEEAAADAHRARWLRERRYD